VYFYDPVHDDLTQGQQPLWPASYRNFAPRLGAAYQLSKDGRTVLRAAAGLFYDSSLSIATDLINGGPLSISSFNTSMFAPVSGQLTYGLMPGLRMPRLVQWNVSLDHAFGARDVVSLGYVASTGDRLLRREIGGTGNTQTFLAALTTNNGRSSYQGLQAQYRRRVVQVSRRWLRTPGRTPSTTIRAIPSWCGPAPGRARPATADLPISTCAIPSRPL
jgi:hypothetical protein